MLDVDELEDVIDAVIEKITYANRTGELEELLEKLNLSNLVSKQSCYEPNRKGKILVIGESEVNENILNGIIKKLGIDKSRFEFCLDYNKAKTFNYKKLQYSPNYSVVIFGPVPHSTTGKHYSSSVIAEMKNNEGYPRLRVLSGNNAIKITKTNFRNTLIELKEKEYI